MRSFAAAALAAALFAGASLSQAQDQKKRPEGRPEGAEGQRGEMQQQLEATVQTLFQAGDADRSGGLNPQEYQRAILALRNALLRTGRDIAQPNGGRGGQGGMQGKQGGPQGKMGQGGAEGKPGRAEGKAGMPGGQAGARDGQQGQGEDPRTSNPDADGNGEVSLEEFQAKARALMGMGGNRQGGMEGRPGADAKRKKAE